MKSIEEKINDVLANWNPINVPAELAHDEYKSYVFTVLNNSYSKDLLFDCICSITTSIIGLDFDIRSETHINDLKRVCDEIYKITSNMR